jgi:hypothetical protein
MKNGVVTRFLVSLAPLSSGISHTRSNDLSKDRSWTIQDDEGIPAPMEFLGSLLRVRSCRVPAIVATTPTVAPITVTLPPWAPSDDPDLAEKNAYLGAIPSLVCES